MKLRILTAALCAVLPLMGGCLQRVDAGLPVQGVSEEFHTAWQLAGEFGDSAPPLPSGADPWTSTYPPGAFREIAGVCATRDEVWVCDTGVSRVQVFDFAGRYLREVGQGNALDGTLPTDTLLYTQQTRGYKGRGSWQISYAAPWNGSEGRLFKAADVSVQPYGYWLVDQARTDTPTRASRGAGYYLVDAQGVGRPYQSKLMLWPQFIAVDGPVVACADCTGNYLWMAVPGTKQWKTKTITEEPNFIHVAGTKVLYAGKEQYQFQMDMATGASTLPGKFNRLGGIAFAYNKLVACDGGNRRLQVFEARPEPASRWGTLLRVIPAENPKLGQRFDIPVDIDIAPGGLIFVLDGGRCEVALLNPRFERIGSFGLGDLSDPRALDVSDDGKHCFVTDAAHNQVFHYATAD